MKFHLAIKHVPNMPKTIETLDDLPRGVLIQLADDASYLEIYEYDRLIADPDCDPVALYEATPGQYIESAL